MRIKPVENLFPTYSRAFTTKDLCSALKIGRFKAYEMIRNGEIKSFRVGRQIRILKSEVESYINRSFDEI